MPIQRSNKDSSGADPPVGGSRGNPLFHIVLHEPEIPNNTGNIGRTCVALRSWLHLVRPLGFDTDEQALRRAGLDYWPRLQVFEHQDWGAALRWLAVENSDVRTDQILISAPRPVWLFTTRASRPLWEAEFHPGDALVFGKETAGLPADILARHPERLVTLPMARGERSLNVATAVCAAMYEGLRQCVARGEARLDSEGRIDWPG